MTRFRKGTRLCLLLILPYLLHGFSTAMGQEDTVPDEPTLTVRLAPLAPYLQEEIVQTIRLIAPHPFEEIVLDLPSGGRGRNYHTAKTQEPKVRNLWGRGLPIRNKPRNLSGTQRRAQNSACQDKRKRKHQSE